MLGPDLPKKQQDEPKRAIRSFKDQKTAFSKPLKNTLFLYVFGSRGIPREPQETQEGSQEAPKELQNLKKKKTNVRQNRGPGRKCLSPAISIFLTFETYFETLRAVLFLIIFDLFWSLFGKLLDPILGSILGSNRPKRDQDEPKRAIRIFKEP